MDQESNSDANNLDNSSQSNRAIQDANTQGDSSSPDAKHNSLADVINAVASSAAKKEGQDGQVQSLNQTREAEKKSKKVEGEEESTATEEEGKKVKDKQDGQKKTEEEKEGEVETEEEGIEEGEDKVVENKEEDANQPPPFHEHPRWKEKLQEVEQLKPLAEQANQLNTWAKEFSVTDQEFQDSLLIIQLLKTDPTKAYERLKPVMDSLAPFIGEKLPKDLQEFVDANKLDPELAKQIAKERSSNQFAQQNRERIAQQSAQNAITQEMNKWESSKKTDPDYLSIKDSVQDRFLRLATTNKITDVKSAVALCERAFTEIKAERQKLIPRPKAKKPFLKSGSSSNAKAEATSLADVVFQTAGVRRP